MKISLINSAHSTEHRKEHTYSYPVSVHSLVDHAHPKIRTGYSTVPHILIESAYRDHIKALKAATRSGRSGFILATGNTHWDGYRVKHKTPPASVPVFKNIALSITNIYAGRIANYLGYSDYIATDATACISSYAAMFMAQLMIESGRLDRVLVMAAENPTAHDFVEFFGEYGACLTLEDEDAGKLPSAFDSKNGGFRIGQGAGFVLLERDGDGAEVDVTMNSEPFGNALGQRDDGLGYKTAMESLDLGGVDLIKTHGTGTPTNNQAERAAIESVFGSDFVATSYKPMIGHTMAPNGIIELDILLGDVDRGVVTGIKNRTEHDEKFLSYDKEMQVNKALCLGSGMGNGFAAMTVTL